MEGTSQQQWAAILPGIVNDFHAKVAPEIAASNMIRAAESLGAVNAPAELGEQSAQTLLEGIRETKAGIPSTDRMAITAIEQVEQLLASPEGAAWIDKVIGRLRD